MRYPGAEEVPGAVYFTMAVHYMPPLAPPRRYQAKLSVGKNTMTQSWEWKKDPRISTTQEEFQEQFDLQIKIRDKISEVDRAINQIRAAKKQINFLIESRKNTEEGKKIEVEGDKLNKKLFSVESELSQTKNKSLGDPLRYSAKLDNKLILLYCSLASADTLPTDQSYELFKEYSVKAYILLGKLTEIMETDLLNFIKLVSDSGLLNVLVKTKK